MGRLRIVIEFGDCLEIKNILLSLEKFNELMNKINEEKNVLFTKKSIKLRKKNGFWLPKEEQ